VNLTEFYFYFILFYFIFILFIGFFLLFFILNLDKEYGVMLCMTQIILSHDIKKVLEQITLYSIVTACWPYREYIDFRVD